MKHQILILVLAMLATAGMTSCNKQQEETMADFRQQWVGTYKSDQYTASNGRYYDVTMYFFIPDDTCSWLDTALFDREHILCLSAYSMPIGDTTVYNDYFYGWIGEDGSFGSYYNHLGGGARKFNGNFISNRIKMEQSHMIPGSAECYKVSTNVPDSVKHHIFNYRPL